MAEGDSVGKIVLDMQVDGDLSKQIEMAASKIGEQLETSIKNMTGNFDFSKITKNVSDTLESTINSALKTVNETINASISTAKENALAAVAEIKDAANEMVQGLIAMTKGIKIPANFGIPSNSVATNTNALGSSASPRAPPIAKIDTGVSFEAIKAQIDNLTSSLDITNAKIEQQKAKLEQLKESYNQAFDGARKNKLEEEILKTEAVINRLTATSDKAGFKLADLDAQFETLSSAAKNATAGVKTVDESLNRTSSSAKKAASGIVLFGNSAKDSTSKASNGINMIGKMLDRMIIRMFLFNTVMKGLTALGTFIGQALMTNTQFARSLAQIKTNLEVAFMPIYQAILPALNSLMSALSRTTAYIAAFVNALFGKTYSASFGAAKNLNSSISSMKAMEEQSKKTANATSGIGDSAEKAAKEAKGSLAGFDEINQLQLNKDTGGGMVTPGVDLSPTSAAMSSITDMATDFKKALATLFAPMKAAWAADGAGVMAEFRNAIDGSVETVKHFFNVLASPPVQSFLTAVDELVLAIAKLALKIYDSFILPIVNWFIDLLPPAAKGLTPIVNAVKGFVDYLSGEGFPIVQSVLSGIIGLIVGIKAFQIGSKIAELLGSVKNIGAALSGLWGIMIANPIVSVVSFIAALVAAFIALYASNEQFRNKANEVISVVKGAFTVAFENIKTLVDTVKSKFNSFKESLENNRTAIEVTAGIIGTVFAPALIKSGIEAAASGGKIAASFVANISKAGLEAVISGAKITVSFIGSLIETAAQAIATAGVITGHLIMSMINYAAEGWKSVAVITAQIAGWAAEKIQVLASTVVIIAHNAAIGALAITTTLATAVTTAFGAAVAFLTSPIGLVVIAIGSLIAVGVLLYKNWDTIKAKAIEVWDAITARFSTFKDWLNNVFATNWATKFGVMGEVLNVLLGEAKSIINDLKLYFGGLIDFITGVFTGNWSKALNGLKEIFEGIWNSLPDSVKGTINGILGILQKFINFWNSIELKVPQVDIPLVGKVGGFSIGVPHIPDVPKLARGGIIDQPTLAMVGDAGKEAVVPLENTEFVDTLAGAVGNAVLAVMQFNKGNSSGNKDDRDIIFKLDGTTFGRLLKPYLDKEQDRMGNKLIVKTI